MQNAIGLLGYSSMPMRSGASHDALQIFKAGIPVGMLFIPCKKGISHSPYEEAKTEDILKASKVLSVVLRSKWA